MASRDPAPILKYNFVLQFDLIKSVSLIRYMAHNSEKNKQKKKKNNKKKQQQQQQQKK